jgi:TIR domain
MQGSPDKPRVLISHSTKAGDPRFLNRLYQTLKQARNNDGTEAFEVWLDQEDMWIGEQWRIRIDEWVLTCDAAIVLLSEAATRSEYVKYEVTLLQQRTQSHPNHMMLLPVCFPEVTDENLKDRMGPQQIAETQIRRLTETNEDEVLDELLSLLRRLPQRAPHHQIEKELFQIFCHSLGDEDLKPIGDALAVGAVLAGAQVDRAQMIIRTLLDAEADPCAVRFRRLHSVLDGLRTKLDKDVRSLLRDWVFPFCWVNAEAAAKLPNLAARAPRTRAVAWARAWDLSERMYLLRGYCHWNTCAIYVSNLDGGGSDGQDSFMEHVISCLYREFFYDRRRDDDEDVKTKLCRAIEKREQEGAPVFLIIPLDALDKNRVQMILNEFPNLTLFIHSKMLTQTEFAGFEFPNTDYLAPSLDLEAEGEAYQEYYRLLKSAREPLDRLNDPERFAR